MKPLVANLGTPLKSVSHGNKSAMQPCLQVTQGQDTLPHTPWAFLSPYIAHRQCDADSHCNKPHNRSHKLFVVMSTGSSISKAGFAGDLGTGLAKPALSLQQHHTAPDLSAVVTL